MTEREYDCPACFLEIEVDIESTQNLVCPNCNVKLGFNCDAEFIDGSWKDNSELYLIK